jgi:hypothetical protein
MTNEPSMDPTKLIDTLRAEDLHRKTHSEDVSIAQKASQAKYGQPFKGQPKMATSTKSTPLVCHCSFCNLDGHNLN